MVNMIYSTPSIESNFYENRKHIYGWIRINCM